MVKFYFQRIKRKIKKIMSNKKDFVCKHQWKYDYPIITICVDFDGTVVEHCYPYVGEESPNCSEIMKRWIDEYQVGFILDTMRDGKELEEAIEWFEKRGVDLYGVGKNPTQEEWTSSNKCHAHFSIDDRNLGCPLISANNKGLMVDWNKIAEDFESKIKTLYEERLKRYGHG